MKIPHILIMEDEENLLEALRYNLELEGYEVSTAVDGAIGLEMAREGSPDLMILDVMMPTLNGFEICRILRKEMDVPILMLTARGEEIDRVVGLELGADDYVVKPFSMRELLARIRGMLRRSRQDKDRSLTDEGKVLRCDDLEIDLRSHTARKGGAPLVLRPREFDLLSLLVSNRKRAFTREQVIDSIWGIDYYGDIRTVDVHIRWLRGKIENDPSNPKRIITVRGVGYRFEG